jgi:hypothetical protein
MRQLLFVLCLSTLLPGCILARHTNNEPIHADRIARLVPGKTTAKEAVEILGAPTEVVQLGKRTAYRYDHSVTKDTGVVLFLINVFNSDTRADRAWVFFDEHEILTHVAGNLHAADASYALPWQSVRDRDDAAKLKSLGYVK